MEDDPEALPLRTQADLLGLSRASLYYEPVPPSPEELALKHRIDAMYTAHPFYGSRRLTVLLSEEFGAVNRKRVQRYMREMGIAPDPNLSKRASEHRIYPYLLRGVTATMPNQIWGSDITYIRLRSNWALDDTLELPFVLDAVQQGLAIATPQIWNTDQGSQYTSPQLTGLLEQAGARISMDGRGRAFDNIFTERFWRSLKYEEVYLHDYGNPREARQGIAEYIRLYNYERPHQALDDRRPYQLYRG